MSATTDYESVVERGLFVAGAVSCAVVFAVFAFLLYFALPLFSGEAASKLFSWNWRPMAGQFGILPMIVGSLCLGLSAMFLAYPLGLGICLFAHGLGPGLPARLTLSVIRFMSGVPTVVYGFAAVFLLVPCLRQVFHRGTGFSLLTAAVTLSFLVLPTIVLLIHSRLEHIDVRFRLGSAALGLTPTQELLWVTLPMARDGLSAAFLMGFGRAVGDTMIALMLTGNAPQVPHSFLDSTRVLTAHIALVLATDVHGGAYNSLFASGLILFAMAGAINLTVRRMRSNTDLLSFK
jgi:phosphate transport system permease protein